MKEVFRLFFPMLCRMFNYYCAVSNETDESLFSMKFNQWTSLVAPRLNPPQPYMPWR